MTDSNPSRLYGVSHGNGNDGVSHMFADYYVRTSDPYRLVELALLGEFKPGKGWTWAKRNAEFDGEAEYTLYGTLFNPPCEDSEDGEYPEPPEDTEPEDMEDGRNWSDGNGAWHICEVFPADESDTRDKPVYESLEEAFTADLLAFVPAD